MGWDDFALRLGRSLGIRVKKAIARKYMVVSHFWSKNMQILWILIWFCANRFFFPFLKFIYLRPKSEKWHKFCTRTCKTYIHIFRVQNPHLPPYSIKFRQHPQQIFLSSLFICDLFFFSIKNFKKYMFTPLIYPQ